MSNRDALSHALLVVTPEQARDIRARAWSFAFRCWQEKKEATRPGGPDDVRKDRDAHTATQIIRE